MSDLDGNPEDRLSRDKVQISYLPISMSPSSILCLLIFACHWSLIARKFSAKIKHFDFSETTVQSDFIVYIKQICLLIR